jgi:uncharacterized protein YraI
MMKHLAPLGLVAMAACALPCVAQAQSQLGFTARSAHVRAGPAIEYPIVASLPPGYQVAVQGCLPDYTWCDVIAGPSRGWMYAGNISYAYQNTYVPVLTYGGVIGIGVFAFVLDDYWGRHYRNHSWYADRARWIDAHPAAAPHFHGTRPAPRFDHPGPAPHFNGPGPRPGVSGPKPEQPRGVVPHDQRSNPSGAVVPGPNAPQRQGSGHDRTNPSGAMPPGQGAPQPRMSHNPAGATRHGQAAPQPRATREQLSNPSGATLPGSSGDRRAN